MEFRITITTKRVISVLLILFLGYIGVMKYQTYSKLGLINMNCEYLLSSIEKNNDKFFKKTSII